MGAKSGAGRVRNPLIEVFRAANRDRDRRVHLDIRDVEGARIIAGRRTSPRTAVGTGELQRSLAGDLERLMNAVHSPRISTSRLSPTSAARSQPWLRQHRADEHRRCRR